MRRSLSPSASVPPPEGSVPEIRPFRALRFNPATIADPALVVAPPYDVIDEAQRQRLLARHPANVVRLDLPGIEQGDAEDDRYRRAARTLAAWRSDGTLHKDPHPSIYVYEQSYRVPGSEVSRIQRGFLARLRLEAFGPGSGVLPHERTLAGPREDRYRLLRATGVNTSPVVGPVRRSPGSRPAGAGRRSWPGTRTWTSPTRTVFDIDSGAFLPTGTTLLRSRRCSRRPAVGRSRSPMVIIATRRRCAIAMNGGCHDRARRIRRSTTS